MLLAVMGVAVFPVNLLIGGAHGWIDQHNMKLGKDSKPGDPFLSASAAWMQHSHHELAVCSSC